MPLLIEESKVIRKAKSFLDSPLEHSQILIIVGIRVTPFGVNFHFEIFTLVWFYATEIFPITIHSRVICSYLWHDFDNIKFHLAEHIIAIQVLMICLTGH